MTDFSSVPLQLHATHKISRNELTLLSLATNLHGFHYCDLPDGISRQFQKFAAALLGPMHFLPPKQRSEIHC